MPPNWVLPLEGQGPELSPCDLNLSPSRVPGAPRGACRGECGQLGWGRGTFSVQRVRGRAGRGQGFSRHTVGLPHGVPTPGVALPRSPLGSPSVALGHRENGGGQAAAPSLSPWPPPAHPLAPLPAISRGPPAPLCPWARQPPPAAWPHVPPLQPGHSITVDCQWCTCENHTLTMSCQRQPCPLPPACPLPGFVPVPAAPQAGQCCPQYNCGKPGVAAPHAY